MDVDFVDRESTMRGPSIYTAEHAPSSSEEFRKESSNVSKSDPQLKISDVSLQYFSFALDRKNTSDRYGSLLCKLLLLKKVEKEFGGDSKQIINYLDGLIIDKNKIQRAC